MGPPVIGGIAKLISHGIGLTAEGIAAAKSSRNQKRSQSNDKVLASPFESSTQRGDAEECEQYAGDKMNAKAQEGLQNSPGYDADDDPPPAYDSSEEDDEAYWALDDAGADSDEATSPIREGKPPLETVPSNEEGKKHYVDKIVHSFVRQQPPPSESLGHLPCPVILPQRRPQNKSRGFVRAYAPVLAVCGIDQAAFLQFLKSMHQASKASPFLNAIDIAAMVGGLVPNPAAMAASIVVQLYFQPRGLYCLVMTYDPHSSASHERIDMSQTISHYLTPDASNIKNKTRNLRLSSGKTQGEIEMPEAAPLIFPMLDVTIAQGSEGKQQSAIKKGGKFFADYYDRRAQAQYTAALPNSKLAGSIAPQQFASRFSDPNHPVNSGSPLALLSGGHIDLSKRKAEKRARKMERKAARRGYTVQPQSSTAGTYQRKPKGVRRFLKKNVLYLMIVNMPSEEELAAARAVLAGKETLK
ncbi:hypothetical protein P7C71_g2291, partial [Lecanoromycetidae sp. Uapishka_2]